MEKRVEQENLDAFFDEAKKLIHESPSKKEFSPFEMYTLIGDPLRQDLGKKLLREGKCCACVLAGGVGSRLNVVLPKGCFPISPILNKSLFELLCDRIRFASLQANYPLEVAIMTSPLNHEATVNYFEKNKYFGLRVSQIHFFTQEMWPQFSLEGEPLQEYGPNGNGDLCALLTRTPFFKEWQKKGVKYISVVPIDNPLADPFDFELFGFHEWEKNEVTLLSTFCEKLDQKVGVLVKNEEGKMRVVEYTEIDNQSYPLANLGLFCFSMSFIEKVKDLVLPIHKAKKKVKVNGEEKEVWKFERFIFDLLPFTQEARVLVDPHASCFAPLKSEKDIESVKKALVDANRKAFTKVTGETPPDGPFELSYEFFYPSDKTYSKLPNSIPKDIITL